MGNNILFISTLCSPKVFKHIFKTSFNKSGNAIQKFHNLIVEGLVMHEGNKVQVLSTIPVSRSTHRQRLWQIPSENVSNIKYQYILIINFPLLKNVVVFLFSFAKVFISKLRSNLRRSIILCDVLTPSITIGPLIASKLLGIKSIAIVTDMPGLDVFAESTIKSLKANIIKLFISRFDGYILITSQMNSVINPQLKPHIVMEGLVDYSMKKVENTLEIKSTERILIYAGAIFERYGIKSLLEAFMMLKEKDLRFHIYGAGPMEIEMQKYMDADSRISYKGVVENEIVVTAQLKATLLVNPRPSTEELTKYSFPSKNMEYMVSGTPIVTTLLPGMPKEYLPYVYLFEDESISGINRTLDFILKKTRSELHEFGYSAKKFVMQEKNNLIQTKKITNFIDTIYEDN